jgi:hypothetical protein
MCCHLDTYFAAHVYAPVPVKLKDLIVKNSHQINSKIANKELMALIVLYLRRLALKLLG